MTKQKKRETIFKRDFTLVVIGQIISLFGNSILRFALPLYIFSETQSAALLGLVTACSFVPMIVLAPIGGIMADRASKRNIMVGLDFATAAIIILLALALGRLPLVPLIIAAMMLLYGIQGAYQPAVQASLPAIVSAEGLLPANAVINQVSSLAGLIGPVAGGALFSFFGIMPILAISAGCFFASAVMELFINIPFTKRTDSGTILSKVKADLTQSVDFIRKKQPIIGKVILIVAVFNLFLSALIIIGVQVLIMQTLGFEQALAARLCGYAQGALAAGGLIGGILTGVFAQKLKVKNAYLLLLGAAVFLAPIGFALYFNLPAMATYAVIVIACFAIMAFATVFSVQLLALAQKITPPELVGKIIACTMAVSMCAQPLGQAIYGALFETLPTNTHLIFFAAAIICTAIAIYSKAEFKLEVQGL